MTPENTAPGRFMTAEAAQSMGVFAQAATQQVNNDVLGNPDSDSRPKSMRSIIDVTQREMRYY